MHTIESGYAHPGRSAKRKIVDIEVVAAWVVAACLLAGLILI